MKFFLQPGFSVIGINTLEDLIDKRDGHV